MKRALALLLTATALAAGCGGSSGSGGGSSGGGSSAGGTSAADLLAASQAATKNATAAAFDLTMKLDLKGHLQTTSSAAALLQGPLTFELRGKAGHVDGGVGKFDINFALNFTGGSFSGRLVSPDGKTAYLQMPTLLGPGWKSIDISKAAQAGAGNSSSSPQSLAQLKALGLDPAKWLTNLSVTSAGGTDSIAADLDLKALVADIAKLSSSPITAKQQAKIDEVVNAVKTAHVSESFDSSTHLPTAAAIDLSVDIPADLRSQASGLTGFDFSMDAKLSDWNTDFTVATPSGATPLGPSLFGGLGSGA